MGCGASSPPPQSVSTQSGYPRQPANTNAQYPVQHPAQHPAQQPGQQAGQQAPKRQQAAPLASYNPQQQNVPAPTGQPQNVPAPTGQPQNVPAPTGQPMPSLYSQNMSGNNVVYNEKQTEIQVRSIEKTKDLLQRYVAIENEVRTLEAKGSRQKYEAALTELTSMDKSIAELEAAFEAAKAKIAKEKKDYDGLYEYWAKCDEEKSDDQQRAVDKEKQEWIEAKGEAEVTQKELDALRQKKALAEEKMKGDKAASEALQAKYKEQEELLASIFDGKYGSVLENKLEAENDFLADRQQRVMAARYKWTNGRNLLQHSTAQLCVGCKKWMEILKIDYRDQRARYVVITEGRNNFIAAAQNMRSAHRYLSTIAFPYCKPEEVKTLETAAANAYADVLSQQRHQYVYVNVYLRMYKQCKALVDWFSHVLDQTISKDMKEAVTAANAKATELRQERLNLISIKIKEELNQDITFDARAVPTEEDTMSVGEDNGQVFEAEGGAAGAGTDEPPPEGEIEAEQPFNPIPLKELVQTPNKEDLFGDAQELYRKHQEDMEELSRNQMINQARQEQGLEEKLKARRSRRQRQAALAAELTVEKADDA